MAIYRATIPHWQGRFQEVIAILEPQAAVCRERKFIGQVMFALSHLGRALAHAGRAGAGIAAARETVALQERVNREQAELAG